MVGIVIVSHSVDVARGLADLMEQVAGPQVRILPAGGAPDDGLGTDPSRVGEAIRLADQGSGVAILCDLGSAVLTTRRVLADEAVAFDGRVRLADAPLVEGGVSAAVTASMGRPLDEVIEAAEGAYDTRKL